MHPPSEFLTLPEVAQTLHCSKAHISNLLSGRVRQCTPLPCVRLGRRILIRKESLRLWIEQNEAAGGNLEASPERGVREHALRRLNA